jgi:hypothetical protein
MIYQEVFCNPNNILCILISGFFAMIMGLIVESAFVVIGCGLTLLIGMGVGFGYCFRPREYFKNE